MAKIQRVTRAHAPFEDSEVYQLRMNFNRLVQKFEALLAKLDADEGVQDTDYVALLGENSPNAPAMVLGHSE